MNYSEARKKWFDEIIDVEIICYKIIHDYFLSKILDENNKPFSLWDQRLKDLIMEYNLLSKSENKSFDQSQKLNELKYGDWDINWKKNLVRNLSSSTGVLTFRKVTHLMLDSIWGDKPINRRDFYIFNVHRSIIYKINDIRNALAHEHRDGQFPTEYEKILREHISKQLLNLTEWSKSCRIELILKQKTASLDAV